MVRMWEIMKFKHEFSMGGKGEGGGEGGGKGGGAGRDSCCRYLIVLMECKYNSHILVMEDWVLLKKFALFHDHF